MQENILQRKLPAVGMQQRQVRLCQRKEHVRAEVRAGLALHEHILRAKLALGHGLDRAHLWNTAKRRFNLLERAFYADDQAVVRLNILHEAVRRVVRNDAALVDDDDARTDRLNFRKDVRRNDHSAVMSAVLDELANLDDLRGIKTNRRLIENQYLRAANERLGKPHALAIALAQVSNHAAGHLCEPDARADIEQMLSALCLVPGIPLEIADKVEILQHAHIRIKRKLLRQITDLAFAGCGIFLNIVPIDGNRTRSCADVAGEDIHCRALTRAVEAKQANDFAGLNGK
ncbi:hypothetical protein SDC9_115152 [bioreactor metagenome]|uniref:Uncharacterized protein n=1 Tax=bioreactor metagenome TaxID=1076179 RepID=A0A645BUC4_9ZZZZ